MGSGSGFASVGLESLFWGKERIMAEKIHDWRELNLQSLDIILCAGNSNMSRRIQKFQRLTGAPKEYSKFSHVAGIDVWQETGGVHVQESTTLNEWACKKGVQRNPMDDWLLNYDGEVYVRKLDFTRTSTFIFDDEELWLEHRGNPYESGIPGGLELLLCALRLHRFIPWYTPIETKKLHCTELQAKRMRKHGILSWEEPTNRLPPWVWCEEIDDMLRCNISELIQIK